MDQLIFTLENLFRPEIPSGMLTAAWIITALAVVNTLLEMMGSCEMFRKSGEKGWKAFIPIYSDYIRFRLFWKGTMYIPFLAMTALSVALQFTTYSGLCPVLSMGAMIVAIILHVNMAASFGQDTGMALLLILFPGLGTVILGFGEGTYEKISEKNSVSCGQDAKCFV